MASNVERVPSAFENSWDPRVEINPCSIINVKSSLKRQGHESHETSYQYRLRSGGKALRVGTKGNHDSVP